VKIFRIPVTFFVSKGPVMATYPFRVLKPVFETDVINCHLPQFEGFMIALLGALLRKRIVVTYQCDMVHGDTMVQRIVKNVLHFSHVLTVTLADTVIVLSDDYAEHSPFLRRYKKKIISVLPPILLYPESKKYKSFFKNKVTGKKVVIGYIGRLSHEKGVEYLLESIGDLEKILHKECVVLLAGPKRPIGEEAYQKRMELLFSKHKKKIISLGTLPDEAMRAFYKSLDVLVLPSTNSLEAFGMVQAEAMLCGTPVVASDLPGVRTAIMLTGMGKIVQPGQPEALAAAIARVYGRRDRYLVSPEKLREIFSYEQTIRSYEQILQGKRPPSHSNSKQRR
jgi:glycosyltransferase involved in cell wall biosynthesis